MANDGKFVNIDSATGFQKQEAAVTASAGASDASKIAALDPTGRFDASLMPVGIVAETKTVPSSENLTAGDLVNLYSNAGVLTARKADGSAAGKPADGFVLATTVSPANATVFIEEAIDTAAAGLTVGNDLFLSISVPGGVQATIPIGAGKVSQLIGKAHSATSFQFRRGTPITLA